jgi:hypothetical protein
MATTLYWISKSVVADWPLSDPVSGVFIPGATVTGTVTLPDNTTAAMTVTQLADRYRAIYDPTMAGLHAYRLAATGLADDAEEGHFYVHTSLTGAEPIELDPTTDVGRVRLLSTDMSEAAPLFTDAQMQAFLDMEGGSVRRAAALALETTASSEALVSKKIRTQDLQTDGPAVAAELRARAKTLREQDAGTDPDGAPASLFDVVDYDPSAWMRIL